MDEYIQVLLKIIFKPRTFQCDFAREHAAKIAEMASRGHITCILNGRVFPKWYGTKAAMDFITQHGVKIGLETEKEGSKC
ncbi:hypothetical protein [Anaeroselena agilis]|uniref:Uncharacterized protein n=1 Tax=Anaeroselena agilis TaxID=3063788 RepID=A0ABU3NV13_9FIRM|nr:hypothetical protein [Selenomonadales bacterium 4137-cl]